MNYTKEEYAKDVNNYTVLLILTDGAIHDMQNSVDQIVEMSKLPISIIIVGIGNADFSKMDTLDSDDVLLQGTRGTAKRDIVQFVPYKDFANNPTSLAANVLHEVPDQVTGFYKSIGKSPNQAKQVNLSTVNAHIGAKGFTRTGTLKDEQYYMKSNF